jgi:hypothetical protein
MNLAAHGVPAPWINFRRDNSKKISREDLKPVSRIVIGSKPFFVPEQPESYQKPFLLQAQEERMLRCNKRRRFPGEL